MVRIRYISTGDEEEQSEEDEDAEEEEDDEEGDEAEDKGEFALKFDQLRQPGLPTPPSHHYQERPPCRL